MAFAGGSHQQCWRFRDLLLVAERKAKATRWLMTARRRCRSFDEEFGIKNTKTFQLCFVSQNKRTEDICKSHDHDVYTSIAMDHRISKGNLPNDRREPTEEANVCIYFIILVDFENNRNEIANGRSSTTQ